MKRKEEKEKCWGAWFNGDEIGRKVGMSHLWMFATETWKKLLESNNFQS